MKSATDVLELDSPLAADGGVAAISIDAARPSHLNDLYELTKPRMNFLVVVTTMVGFYMASAQGLAVNWMLLMHTLVGTALTAAGASVLNQYVERNLDARMRRTANRPLPAGRVGPLEALAFGVILSIGGVAYLALGVNELTAALGAITLLSYVFLYTPMKRWTTLCTIVGAVPGAIPPMMGWTAVHDEISIQAVALFGILFFWQMPHFLAIAILYKDDYAAGGFKMLPVVDQGLVATSRQIVLYSAALIPVSLFPTIVQMAGPVYFVLAALMGIGFFAISTKCAITRSRSDARLLFLASIIYLPLLLAAMMLARTSPALSLLGSGQ